MPLIIYLPLVCLTNCHIYLMTAIKTKISNLMICKS